MNNHFFKPCLPMCTFITTSMFMISAHAASFNCAQAKTKTEHRICENMSLNDADVKMATTYTIIRHLVPMGTRGAIQDEQVKWQIQRNQCQDDLQCLKTSYQKRQQALDLHMDRIYKQGPF